jgi:hypothetical protein
VGEAKRRQAVKLDLREVEIRDDIIVSVLARLAGGLDAAICVKQADDGLLEWPPGTVVGQAFHLNGVRACPLKLDVRLNEIWEFPIPDKILIGGYCVAAYHRGLAFSEATHPDRFPEQVREFLQSEDGWAAVIPQAWGRALTRREGTLQ